MISIFKFFIIFILNGFIFLSISVLIGLYEPLLLLVIDGIVFRLIDKIENKINYTKNLYYLAFNISSTILYILVTLYLSQSFFMLEKISVFWLFFAIGAFLLKSYLLYIGKVEEWKIKYQNQEK